MKLFPALFLLGSGLLSGVVQAQNKETARIQVGQFTASRFEKAPVIDAKVSPGEWDRAMTTSGMITPFKPELQETETVLSLGFDQERLYFLFRCRRGDNEWKLWKKARLNDDYNFGEPSVEVWISPPSDVPETYQNILNTYPAVFDLHQIPSRGYNAQGWKADWKVAAAETDTDYIIEASVPFKDFGRAGIKSGDIWNILLARNAPNAKPRPQASWSITQGFAEIPQHPPVRLVDDGVVAQFTGVQTIFTGNYAFEVGVVAPQVAAAEATVELRFQTAVEPSPGDKIEIQKLSVKAGEKTLAKFSGDVTAMKKGFFSVTATEADGSCFFKQTFPFNVNGWVPKLPVRPENTPAAEEVTVTAQFGPETGTILVKTDILDFPKKAEVASSTVRVVDPATGKVLAEGPMRTFKESYGGAELHIPESEVPVDDFRKVADLQLKNREIRNSNQKLKDNKAKPAPGAEAAKPVPLLEIPHPEPRKVQVVVVLKDKDGKELKSITQELALIRYAAEWMNNSVGVTDKVIPPWTPVEVKGSEVGVWNRTLSMDGLGLGQQVINGGVRQLAAPMRLVAVKDGKEIEIKAGVPKVERQVENEVDFSGSVEAAGLNFSAQTAVEFDGFVLNKLKVAPSASGPVKVDKLFLEIELPADMATHFCASAGGWAAVHDVLPDRWTSQSTASGMLVGDFVPYIWLTNSEQAFMWFADHDKGWNHEAEKALPTQEIVRKDGKVILRVNFFEIPTLVDAERTLTWGWQTFPSRPLPKGWRATYCASAPPPGNTKNSYFWTAADGAALWHYYSSPFAWNFNVSKEQMAKTNQDPRHRSMVGSIAHSIGRYQDYDWNMFPGLVVDWGTIPGEKSNGRVTSSKGPNDFRLWNYQRWAREGGIRGIYVDENYLALEDNFLTGNAYWKEDGTLQRAYNYIGLRDYFKRIKVMFYENKVPEPNLWQHISSGAAYHAWFGDIFFEGENVEPTNLQFDYMEVLPAGRLRSIGSSVTAGGIMTMMCQSMRHKTEWSDKHTHQFVGWVMAHDILPEQSRIYPYLVEAGKLWEDEIKFLPYWKPSPFTTQAKDCLISAHRSSDRALLWVVNKGRADAEVKAVIDWKAAGFDPATTIALNAETGQSITLDASGFTTLVLQRDFVPVLLAPKGTTITTAPEPKNPAPK